MRIIILLSILFLPFGKIYSQDCSVIGPIQILPLETTQINLTVSGLVNDDLGSNQAICGIRLVFNHNQLENIRITLISPSGQEVTLVGPGTAAGNLTSLVLWDIAFNPCMNPAAPDPGFLDVWENDQPWSSFETYTGIYHPNQGCLEDFNLGTANGNWTINIENLGTSEGALEYFELIFCDDTGSACSDCFLFAGEFDNNFEIFCESDIRLSDLNIFLDNEFVITGEQDFTFLLFETDTLLHIGQSMINLDTLETGVYTLCALAFDMEDTTTIYSYETYSELETGLNNFEFCGDLSDNCFVFEILESSNTVNIDTVLCRGDTLRIRDLTITDQLDTVITVFDTTNLQPFVIECDSVYNISIQIIDIEANIVSAQTNIVCGNTLFLNGSSSNSSFGPISAFEWSTQDGMLSNTIGPITEALQAGTFVLTIGDSFCSDKDSIQISEQSEFNVSLTQQNAVCFNDTLIVDIVSEFSPDSAFLSGPNVVSLSENQFITLETGQFILESYFGSCVSSDTINITNDAAPINIQVSYDTIDCVKDFADVSIMTNATNPSIIYQGPENIMNDDFSPEIIIPGMYFITIIDEQGCETVDSFEIISDMDNPEVFVMPVNISCNEGPVALPLSSDINIDSVQWFGPDNFMSVEINPLSDAAGIYYVEVFASNGCSMRDSLELTITNETILFGVEGDTINCENALAELCVDSAIMIDSINWIYQGGIESNQGCILTDQPGQYTIEVFDENGCFGIQNYELINTIQALEAAITEDQLEIFCDNVLIADAENSQLTSSTMIQWLDQNNNVISTELNLEVPAVGQYYLNLFDTLSLCQSTDSIVVIGSDSPFLDLNFNIEHPACFGENGMIAIDNYPTLVDFDVFINGELAENQDSLFSLPSGEYLIEFIDENACFYDTLLNILQGTNVNLDLGPDQTVGLGTSLSIDAQVDIIDENIVSYVWSHPELLSCISCLNPDLVVNENLTLSLEIEDINGCSDTDELKIFTDNRVDLFVPNVFTPDGDGDNDILTIFISDQVKKIFDFQIIDRWGNLLIFHPEIAQEGSNTIWDGTSQGKFVEDGVYIYMATLLLLDDSEAVIFGNVTLLK